MMRALIVDDELHAREELEALLLETGAFEIAGKCANAVEAMQALRREKPDVLFLDIQMPAISGLELLSMLDDAEVPSVVFVTAHDEFALRAFDASATDYLLKPVDRERLARTVERLRRVPRGDVAALPRPAIVRIPCLVGRAIKLLDVRDVELARSSDAGVYVVGPKGEHFTELTLKVLEERAGLVRCHKQFLVNVDAVDEIRLEEGFATVRTRAGNDVPVSRRFLPKLRERLGI